MVKFRIFSMKNYVGKSWVKLPLICKACGHIIQEGEKFEVTYHGKNVFCEICSNKEVLVYSMRGCGIKDREITKIKLLENVEIGES